MMRPHRLRANEVRAATPEIVLAVAPQIKLVIPGRDEVASPESIGPQTE
jgi:hypothetical protein